MITDIKAGKLFLTSRGEYSDYRVEGHFLALRDITVAELQEIVAECNAEHEIKDADQNYYGSPEDTFLPRLIQRGLIMDIDVRELHTGSYGRLELE